MCASGRMADGETLSATDLIWARMQGHHLEIILNKFALLEVGGATLKEGTHLLPLELGLADLTLTRWFVLPRESIVEDNLDQDLEQEMSDFLIVMHSANSKKRNNP